MKNVPIEAAYLREALRLGAVGVEDVISWSDQIVADSPAPDVAFVNLSCMRHAHPLDVLHALESMSGHVPTIEVLPAVLGLAHQRLVSNPEYGRDLARALYGVYVKCDHDVPVALRNIGWFDDAFDLAAQGSFGSVEDVQQRLVEFTKQFAA